MDEIGVVFGRFQIMHLGYMEYILAAKMRCRHLVIGIGNPDMDHLQYNRSQDGCMKQKLNPFTYYERMEMIQGALRDFGIGVDAYTIVPFPLENPPALSSYLPRDAVYYMNIFDDWSREKKQVMESLGYRIHILSEGNMEDKKTRSEAILEAMGKKKAWDQKVPKSVAVYIKENELDERVRTLWKGVKLGPKGAAARNNMPPFRNQEPEVDSLSHQQEKETRESRERDRKREKTEVDFLF